MPWSVVVKFYYSVDCGFLKGISCLAPSRCCHRRRPRSVRASHTLEKSSNSFSPETANPLPPFYCLWLWRGSSNCFRRSGNIIDGAEGGEAVGREGGRKGDFAVVYHRGRSRITTLESPMADRPTQRRPSLPPTDDSRGLSVVAAFPSLKGGIEVNERE